MAHYGRLRDYRFSGDVDDIRGSSLYGVDDEKLGKIDDVIFDHSTATIQYAVVDSGGWLSSKKFLVSADRIRPDTKHEDDFYADMTKQQIEALPRYDEDKFNKAGEELIAGKVVIDTTNPISKAPPVDGVVQYFTGPNSSLLEELQAKFPQARLVKAFNSVGNAKMVNPVYEQGRPSMFFCGNDADAKKTVATVLEQFGWEPVDMGKAAGARAIEPLCQLWCIPGFLQNRWTHAFAVFWK